MQAAGLRGGLLRRKRAVPMALALSMPVEFPLKADAQGLRNQTAGMRQLYMCVAETPLSFVSSN